MHSAFSSLPKNFDKSEIGSYVINGKNTVMIQMNISLADVDHRIVCLLVLVVEFTCTVCAAITNRADHVANGGIRGPTVLCGLTRDVHPVLCPLCVAEDSLSREGFQFCRDYGCPRLQQAFVRLRLVRGDVDRKRSLTSPPLRRIAA